MSEGVECQQHCICGAQSSGDCTRSWSVPEDGVQDIKESIPPHLPVAALTEVLASVPVVFLYLLHLLFGHIRGLSCVGRIKLERKSIDYNNNSCDMSLV